MYSVLLISFKGILRDKLYQGIVLTTVLFLTIPATSTFSLRQVAALATTLSLSLTSFILLLISVFLGGTSLWKDIERKYVYSALGMPMRRSSYLVGKYLGICGFLFLTACVLGLMAIAAVYFAAAAYPPDKPILWANLGWAILLDGLKYSLLVAVAFMLSTLSTSFFLPIFGTIAVFLAGSATQEVFDYLHTTQGQELPATTIATAKALYFLLPNLSAFDLSTHAIYGLPISTPGLLLVLGYGICYISILLCLACLFFSRRDLQ